MIDMFHQHADDEGTLAMRSSGVLDRVEERVRCRPALFSPRLDIDRYAVDDKNRIIRLEPQSVRRRVAPAGSVRLLKRIS